MWFQDTNPFNLNVAALRVTLGILPGLENSIFVDTDGLIGRLFGWAEGAEEPLSSYSVGVLAAAMEVQETVTNPDFRERNHRIVPMLISRVKTCYKEAQEERRQRRDTFKRPFAVFAAEHSALDQPPKAKIARRQSSEGIVQPEVERCVSEQNSNSSWAEMAPTIIGHFQVHPLSRQARMVFALKLLTPLAEYQEFLSIVHVEDLVSMIKPLLNVSETQDTRLAFETLRLVVALNCHKKFLTEWVSRESIDLLLSIPKPSVAASAVCQALHYLSLCEVSMEKICCMPETTLNNLIK